MATFILALRGLPSMAPNRARSLDVPGQVLAALALGAVTYGLIEAARSGWSSPTAVVALVVGIVLAAAFVVVEHRTPDAVLPPDLLRSGRLLPYVATGLLLFVTYYGLLFTVNLYFQQFQKLSAFDAGLRLLPAAIPVFALPLLVSRLAKKANPVVLTGSAWRWVAWEHSASCWSTRTRPPSSRRWHWCSSVPAWASPRHPRSRWSSRSRHPPVPASPPGYPPVSGHIAPQWIPRRSRAESHYLISKPATVP